MKRIYATKLKQLAEKLMKKLAARSEQIDQSTAETYDLAFFNLWATAFEVHKKHEVGSDYSLMKDPDQLEEALQAFLFKKVGGGPSLRKIVDEKEEKDWQQALKELDSDLSQDGELDDLDVDLGDEYEDMPTLDDLIADEDFDVDEFEEEEPKKKFKFKQQEAPKKKFKFSPTPEQKKKFQFEQRAPKYGPMVQNWERDIKDFGNGRGVITVTRPDGSSTSYQPSGNIYKFIVFKVKKILNELFISDKVIEIAERVALRILNGNILLRAGDSRVNSKHPKPKDEKETTLEQRYREFSWGGFMPEGISPYIEVRGKRKKTVDVVTKYINQAVTTETWDYMNELKKNQSLSQSIGGEEGKERTLESVIPGKDDLFGELNPEDAHRIFEELTKKLEEHKDEINAQAILKRPTSESDTLFETFTKLSLGDTELIDKKIQQFMLPNNLLVQDFFNQKAVQTREGVDLIKTEGPKVDIAGLDHKITKYQESKIEKRKEFNLKDRDRLRLVAIYQLGEILRSLPTAQWSDNKLIFPSKEDLVKFTSGIEGITLGLDEINQKKYRSALRKVLDTVGLGTAQHLRERIVRTLADLRGNVSGLSDDLRNYIDNAILSQVRVEEGPSFLKAEIVKGVQIIENALLSLIDEVESKGIHEPILKGYLARIEDIRKQTNNFEKANKSLARFTHFSKDKVISLSHLDQLVGSRKLNEDTFNTLKEAYKEVGTKIRDLDYILRSEGAPIIETQPEKKKIEQRIPKRVVKEQPKKFKFKIPKKRLE